MKIVVPVLTKIIKLITDIVQALGKATAKITGGAWVKAASDVNKYKTAVQEANRATAGFDDLNTLNTSDSNNSNFEVEDVEGAGSTISNLLNNVINTIKPLLELITSILEPVTEIVVELLPAVESILNGIMAILKPIINAVSKLITNILKSIPLSFWDSLSKLISQIVDLVLSLLQPIFDLLDSLDPVFGGQLSLGLQMTATQLEMLFTLLSPIIAALQTVSEVTNAIRKTLMAIITLDFESIGDIWGDLGTKLSGI